MIGRVPRGRNRLQGTEAITVAEHNVQLEALCSRLVEARRGVGLRGRGERRAAALPKRAGQLGVIEVTMGESDARNASPLLRRRPHPLHVLTRIGGTGVDHVCGPIDQVGVGTRQSQRARIRGPYPFDPLRKGWLVHAGHRSRLANVGARPRRAFFPAP